MNRTRTSSRAPSSPFDPERNRHERPALIAAITAAAAFAESEEPGVQIVAARSADLVDRWFVVEGRRKSFRRIYVVAVREAPLEPVVVEMIGGSRLNDEALIAFALQAIQGGQAVGGGRVACP